MVSNAQQAILDADAKLAQIDSQIAEARNSARDWRASKSQCAGTAKKKAECAAGKEARAVQYDQQVINLTNQKEQLLKTKETLKASVIAENQATINLSSQGLSNQALILAAEGQAAAAQKSAEIKATAEASAIEKESGSKTLTNQVILAVSSLVVIIVLVIVVKKFAGKKKPKPKSNK